jgi:serine/threonine protein kinase
MKTESSLNENKNKMRKIDKINKKSKTIQTKPGHSNSFKQRGNFSNNLNKYNISLSNKKDENNNSSILNDQKKNSLSINKHLNIKQNKLPINKKLNIIKEANENQIMVSKNINNNKKYNQRNNNINSKQIMMDKNKSYIAEEKKRLNMGKLGKKEGESFSLKRLTLQDNEKYFSNLKFNSNKSSNIDGFLYDKNKKEKEHSKNNQVINVHKNNNLHSNNMGNDINLKKNKLKKLLNIKKNNDANQDDIFVYDENKPITLTQEELDIYGDRNMKGYSKVRILGKGGYGVVWLCKKIDFNENDENNNMDYAVKQTSKKNAPAHNKEDVLQIAKNEIDILIKLNENNDENDNKRCELIPKIYETYEDNNDVWFSFEKGGLSLSTLTFNIKGIFEKGERLYHIQKGEFLLLLFKNIKQFKLLLRKILEGIDYINKKGIIHSDIKPENILVQYTKNSDILEISSIKIVDYGSAFYTSNQSPLISNTPEYLCPEIMTNNKEFIKELNMGNYINAIDIWSTGISILELCLCCPIWMSYKTKIYINGKINNNMGYFGCKGRDGNKIYQKQIELSHNLNKILKNSMIYMFDNKSKSEFIDLLSKMLTFDYTKRITTKEALRHPFLNEEINKEHIEEAKDNYKE